MYIYAAHHSDKLSADIKLRFQRCQN